MDTPAVPYEFLCPLCGAEWFACTTDWRGLCIERPKPDEIPDDPAA